MPVPTTYSEHRLSEYLISQLEELADVLGWSSGSVQVAEAVNDALLDYGEPTISAITGATALRKLRALGRRAIWRAVVQATVGDYSFSSDGQRFDRQQVNEQARKMLELAEIDCRVTGADPDYAVQIVSISRPHDPYAVILDEDRVLP